MWLLYKVYAKLIALWCNGSTTDFGSVRAGSNPARVTNAISSKLLAKINGYRVFKCGLR